MEIVTGVDLSKKLLPKIITKKIELKKNRLKENGSISVLGFVNKLPTKGLKNEKTKNETLKS
tara:strand:+ start:364 stop:549 length:186 start_codon:yes stop_codon:yes gene_type:complete